MAGPLAPLRRALTFPDGVHPAVRAATALVAMTVGLLCAVVLPARPAWPGAVAAALVVLVTYALIIAGLRHVARRRGRAGGHEPRG